MAIRYVSQASKVSEKTIIFPVDDEITFTDEEKEVLQLAISYIETDFVGIVHTGCVLDAIGLCGDPTIPVDTSVACRLAGFKARLILERCDPDYAWNHSHDLPMYETLKEATKPYLDNISSLLPVIVLADETENGLAWLKYLIERC
jgi:hypothetical protein